MHRKIIILTVISSTTLFLVRSGWADVPAPPVNQNIGLYDTAFLDLEEADCRACHDSGVPNRHHMLYGQPQPNAGLPREVDSHGHPNTNVPYWDLDGDGLIDDIFVCLSCHDENFTPVRDCTVCHEVRPHHAEGTPARDGQCQLCHGAIVDDRGDGHYIPPYAPSLVTPLRSVDDDPATEKPQGGEPLNSRGNGAGACNYCHDGDLTLSPPILSNHDTHHGTGLLIGGDGPDRNCEWCHSFDAPYDEQIRVCENCHGPDSLHNIQVDSPNPDNPGTIVVGGEDAGWGHVGRDAGPGDSDCWGCHGFPMATAAAVAPGSGPIIPSIITSDRKAISNGADTQLTVIGSSFTNVAGETQYESNVVLTGADDSSVILTPDSIDEGVLTVTIPRGTPPGNYGLRAVKADFASNPTVISIAPEVTITSAVTTAKGTVIIKGSGFGGYAANSGTAVTTLTSSRLRPWKIRTVKAWVVSWSDTRIVATFAASGLVPKNVTVRSVFGKDSSLVAAR